MKKFEKISILGAGSWGCALANVFAEGGAQVLVWGRDPKICRSIRVEHQNRKYLMGHVLDSRVSADADLDVALKFGTLIVNAIPTQSIRDVFAPIAVQLKHKPILNVSKGIELGSLRRVSQLLGDLCPQSPYAVLSGPSFAEEVMRRLPTAVTIASADRNLAAAIQASARTPYFRTYTTADVLGVELAGALKNVIAIATGLVDGLELGFNAQAAVINRGLVEMTRLASALGASPMTFFGLAGVGDLVLTCTGPLSRNRTLGRLLAQGFSLEQAQAQLGGVAEGVATTQSAFVLATSLGLELPILSQVLAILRGEIQPRTAVDELMSRDLKEESLAFGNAKSKGEVGKRK